MFELSLRESDMIAILVLLKTVQTHENWFARLGNMGSFTREDLVALIRAIVFDPVVVERIVASFVGRGGASETYAALPGVASDAIVPL